MAPHKPVLQLAVIELVERSYITSPVIDQWLYDALCRPADRDFIRQLLISTYLSPAAG